MWEMLVFWGIFLDFVIILKKLLIYMLIFGWYVVKLGNISIDCKGGLKILCKMFKDVV